jgi:hypothetical protein
MTKKPFNVKLKRNVAEAIMQALQLLLQTAPNDDDDKLLFCVLEEIRHRLHVRLDVVQVSYQFTFPPAQAFALRILSTDFITDYNSQLGAILNHIAMEVHKKYS